MALTMPEEDVGLPRERRYSLLGFDVEVVSDSAAFVELLDRFNAEFTAAPAGEPAVRYEVFDYGGATWELTFQDEELRWCDSLLAAVGHIEWHMTEQMMNWQTELVHLHGAVLGGPAGSLLLPGASGIGKTTLALALTLRGLRLYADDVAFLRPDDRRPVPFPRTLHIHDDALAGLVKLGWRNRPDEHVGKYLLASALRPWPATPGPPLRLIVLPELDRRGPLALEPLTAAEAAAALLRVSRNLRRWPRYGLDLLPRLLTGIDCYRLRWNEDLAAAADLVAGLVMAAA